MASTTRDGSDTRTAEVIAYRFAKNGRGEEVRATVSTFKGLRLADLRVYTPEGKATHKGVCVRVEQLDDLEKAVQALIETERAA